MTAMVLIDLSKTFDSLSHPVLLTKLHNLGASENALAWFKSYLSERLQTTRVATSVSSPLLATHGVPQGSILGFMLFNLYMKELPSVTKECETESYVDDTKKTRLKTCLKLQRECVVSCRVSTSRLRSRSTSNLF